MSIETTGSGSSYVRIPGAIGFRKVACGVSRVRGGTFTSRPSLEGLIFPSARFRIVGRVIRGDPGLRDVYFQDTLPPIVNGTV